MDQLYLEACLLFNSHPYHGKLNINNKYTFLCPYCQAHKKLSGKKKIYPHDAAAALLWSFANSYEFCTFHCVACKTTKRLDILLRELKMYPSSIPSVRIDQAVQLYRKVSSSSQGQAPKAGISSEACVEGNESKITKLRPSTPEEQAGWTGYYNAVISYKKNKKLPWWEKAMPPAK